MSPGTSSEVKFEIGHVLFIDIVGYSKLLIHEQSEQMQTLREIVRGTEQFRAAEAEGKLLRLPTGDGGALVFRTSPEAPVRCALEISKELNKHPELRVRMGVHSGAVNEIKDLNEQANVAGAGINVAQRIMDCGDAGHILLSRHVAEDLEHYRQWQPCLHDLGECEVKHGVRVHAVNFYTDEVGNPEVPQKFKPVAVAVSAARAKPVIPKWTAIGAILILIAIATFLFWQRGKPKTSAPASVIPEKSIAVLPFANQSRDPDNAYFADGIQDEILTRLSKIADLKVISRTSTQHYKSAPENLPEIAKQLGEAHILEGSVQKSADSVRVNVQLIKAANDSHLWADTYDRKLTDIFSVETDVAKAIADRLQVQLTGREEQEIAAKPTDNVEAYDAYLRGLAYGLKAAITPANSVGAQKYLREAVRLDPKFALGWALLSYVDAVDYITQNLQPTVALREEARQAAETALSLQPKLGEAILAKGYYHYACLKDYGTTVRYFEQAGQFLPNNSQIPAAERALVALGDNQCWNEGAINLSRSFGEGLLARMTKDEARARTAFEAARAQQEKIVQARQDYGPPLCVLALIDAALGRNNLALDEGRRAIALTPLEKDGINGSFVLQYFAITAAWAGEKELALQQLEAGLRAPVASQMQSYGALKLLPFWDPLRDDPRFEKIVESLAPKERH